MTAVGPGGPNGEQAYVLYSVWTEFDDVGSYLGFRTPEVEQEMRSAAQDWLTVHQSDSGAWRAYYERWLARIKVLIKAHRSTLRLPLWTRSGSRFGGRRKRPGRGDGYG